MAAVLTAAALWSRLRPAPPLRRSTPIAGATSSDRRSRSPAAGSRPSRSFDVAVDGIDFGQSTTNIAGAFSSSLLPGGLGAGLAEYVHHLDATDGTLSADARFTVTRAAGARFLSTRGNPHTLRAPFEVWGFSLGGSAPVDLSALRGAVRAGPAAATGWGPRPASVATYAPAPAACSRSHPRSGPGPSRSTQAVATSGTPRVRPPGSGCRSVERGQRSRSVAKPMPL